MVHRVTPYFLKVDSCLKLRKSYKQKACNSYFWFAKTYKHEHQLIVPCLWGTGSRSDEDWVQK